MNKVAQRLMLFRQKSGLSQNEFVNNFELLGVDTYKNYEQGKSYPRLPTLIKFAEFYDVSLNYLVGLTESKEKYRTLDIEQFPKRTIELRRKSGMSQSAIAKQIGVTKSGYKCYEMGKSIPPLPRLIALADLFDVSVDYLVGLDVAE